MASGYTVGINFSPAEAQIVKQVIRDIVENHKSIQDALKDAVLAALIQNPEAQSAAQCFVSGTSVASCALQQLPPAVQAAIKQCANNPFDAEKCARDALIEQLPPQAQQAAQCLASGAKVEDCANQYVSGQLADALSSLQHAALNQGDRYFQAAPTEIQNIVNLVDGIQQGNVGEILANGGAAVAKVVVKQIVNSLLPPGVAALAGPVIDKIIEDRIDLASDLVHAAKEGDAAQATQIVVEFYLTIEAEVPCTLLNEVPGLSDLKEATRGTVAKIIAAFGSSVKDGVQYVENLIKDPENILDIPGDLVGDLGKLQNWWLGKDTNCSSLAEYYGKRYAACFTAAESKSLTNPAAEATFVNQLDQQCTSYFNQCFVSGKSAEICHTMRATFDRQAQQLDQGVRAAATTYSRDLRHYVENRGGCGEHAPGEICAGPIAACDPAFLDWGYKEFIGQCGSAVEKQVPLGGVLDHTINGQNSDQVSLTTNCVPSQPRFANNYLGNQACSAVVSQSDFDKMAAQVCRQNTSWTGPDPANPIIKKEFDTGLVPVDTPASQVLREPQGDAIPSFAVLPNTPLPVGPDPAAQIFRGGGGGDAIPSFGNSPNTPTRNPTTFVPGGAPSSSFVQPTTTPFRPGPTAPQIFNGNSGGGGISTVQPGGISVLKQNAPGGTAARFGVCPPNMAPDGHGGCEGGGIDTAHSGGTSVPKPNASGGAASARGVLSPVQPGGHLSAERRPGSEVTGI